jgi:putative colanic acid biosynthesis UDP-glucose lipid carrier transferase
MNRLFAGVQLCILSPLLFFLSIVVFFFINKKIIFKQTRLSQHGKKFICYKFFSMINPNKINTIGNYLRYTHLDELPQLYNILKGDMNFIGPRPLPVNENLRFAKLIKNWHERYKVKAGITGLAQTSGYAGKVTNYKFLLKRHELDLRYVKKQSQIINLIIIFKTVIYFFKK